MFLLAFCMVALSKQGHRLPYWGRNKYWCMEENIDLQLVRPGLKKWLYRCLEKSFHFQDPSLPIFRCGDWGERHTSHEKWGNSGAGRWRDYPKVTETENQSEEPTVSLLISSLILQTSHRPRQCAHYCFLAGWTIPGLYLGWHSLKFPWVLLPEWDLKNHNIPDTGKGGEPPVLQPVLEKSSDRVFWISVTHM